MRDADARRAGMRRAAAEKRVELAPLRRRLAEAEADVARLTTEIARIDAALAEPVAAARVDYAILVGDEMEALAKALGDDVELAHVPDAAAAIAAAREAIGPGDAVLVKGSNSIGLAAVVEALARGKD